MISLSNRNAVPSLLALFLSILPLVACGGAYPGAPPAQGHDTSLTGLTVQPTTSPSIAAAGNVRLRANGYYNVPIGQNSYQDLTSSAIWSTSNAAVATVNSGLATATGIGSATITATFGGKTGSATIVVGLTPTIAITPTSTGMFSRSATAEQQFHAVATYSDGTVMDLTDFVTWSSSSAGVLEFSLNDPYGFNPGLATFVGTGTTTIAATLDTGEAGTMAITVVP
jgi:hypothetical protein